MNVSDYKRRLVVTVAAALTIGFSASFAIADGGVAMLSDTVRPVAYADGVSAPPPSPFADPVPNAVVPESTPQAVESVPAESGVANISSGGFVEEAVSISDCGGESCYKPYVLGSEFKRFLQCCPPPTGAWVRTDYLLWWTKGGEVPPLVTTVSDPSIYDPDTQPTEYATLGALGSPYTSVLYGDKVINYANRSGIRASGGFLFECGRAIEFDYLTLGRVNNGVDFSSDGAAAADGAYSVGNPFLARPLINNDTDENVREEVAGEYLRGRIRANQSEFFQSYGIWFRRPICCPQPTGCCDESCDEVCGESCSTSKYCGFVSAIRPRTWQIDFIGGWRNYRLEEWTTVHENLTVESSPPGTLYPQGTTFDVSDAFETENVFNGAELGLTARRCYGRLSVDLLAKVGLGSQTQTARINGGTIITTPFGDSAVYDAGLLALDSNIGHYSRDKFVAIPQFGGEISYQLTKYLRAHMGYNIIYWPNVVRSGALIDLNVDMDQIPPPTGSGTRPAFTWNESDYWAQGLNFGLEARF